MQAERDAFCNKLSNLNESDAAMVVRMRRALEALLEPEEAILAEGVWHGESGAEFPAHTEEAITELSGHSDGESSVDDGKELVPLERNEIRRTDCHPFTNYSFETAEASTMTHVAEPTTTDESHFKKDGDNDNANDAWMKFGFAALGVVVGGVVLSMQGGENKGDNGGTCAEQRNTSTVEIEELGDEGEDEWISVQASSREQ